MRVEVRHGWLRDLRYSASLLYGPISLGGVQGGDHEIRVVRRKVASVLVWTHTLLSTRNWNGRGAEVKFTVRKYPETRGTFVCGIFAQQNMQWPPNAALADLEPRPRVLLARSDAALPQCHTFLPACIPGTKTLGVFPCLIS